MRTGGIILGAVVAAVLVLVAVVLVRTVSVKAPPAAAGMTFAAAPAVDVNRAAGTPRRGDPVQHRQPPEPGGGRGERLGRPARLAGSTTYPAFHAAARREIVGAAPGALLWTWDGSDPTLPPIVLMAHQDVVPVEAGTEKDWSHAPFAGQLDQGAVWGRGAIDDKGSLIALMEAVDALAASGFKPKRTVMIVSGDHEEKGGEGAVASPSSSPPAACTPSSCWTRA